jgi:hypothetical protein
MFSNIIEQCFISFGFIKYFYESFRCLTVANFSSELKTFNALTNYEALTLLSLDIDKIKAAQAILLKF